MNSRTMGIAAATVILCASYGVLAAAADASAPLATEAGGGREARSFTPEDFVRFAPRNALEMLRQVPGFLIDSGDAGRRGLGQATANVLINGQRFAGKSNDILTELARIPSDNVERIEIVDGATLDVPGLSGQVANVVVAAGDTSGTSGTFAWRPQYRPETDQLRPYSGEISISGQLAGFDYTAAVSNNSFVFGNAGTEMVFAPDGTIIDLRDEVLKGGANQPRLSGSISRDFEDGSEFNVNGAVGLEEFSLEEISLRSGPGRPDRDRRLTEERSEWGYELGGDYEFGLGGGRLKLIGLRRFEHIPFGQQVLVVFADGRPTKGGRFTRFSDETESILRGEYRWQGGDVDWQVAAEGALNTLEVDNALFRLEPDGDFVVVDFPNSSATVEEERAEMSLSYGRPLADNLTLQASLGGEYSKLSQSGSGALARTFYRPKGFVSLAWDPSKRFDVSARIEREVWQLNFFDFVASANLLGGTRDAGNAELVPPQSWDAEAQATRDFGAYGTATARVFVRLISDIVDIVPIGETGQSPGNLESATVFGGQLTGTINFDPLGLAGAKLDIDILLQDSALKDPLTGLDRRISDNRTERVAINFRQDVPRSDWAYGARYDRFRQSPGFRLDLLSQFTSTRGNLGLFVENKDVAGLRVRATIENLLDTNEKFERDLFDGRRTGSVQLIETRDRFYGPVFTISISGTV